MKGLDPNLMIFLKELFVMFEKSQEKNPEVSIFFRTYKETKKDPVKPMGCLGKYQMLV